jgi:hypothetical protein
MDSRTIDKLKHALNTDVVRRMLVRYFRDKDFNESFDRLVYPAILQDLPMALPVLTSKVEVEPHAREVDPNTGKAVLGWNLYVLGTHRMYLGETYHRDLAELARQIQAGLIMIPEGAGTSARRQSTPRQIINFITRVLSRHEFGYVDLMPGQGPGVNPSLGAGMAGSQFYTKPG